MPLYEYPWPILQKLSGEKKCVVIARGKNIPKAVTLSEMFITLGVKLLSRKMDTNSNGAPTIILELALET